VCRPAGPRPRSRGRAPGTSRRRERLPLRASPREASRSPRGGAYGARRDARTADCKSSSTALRCDRPGSQRSVRAPGFPTRKHTGSEEVDVTRRTLATLALLTSAAACTLVVTLSALGANANANARAVCPGPPASAAHCHALVATDARGNPLVSSSPTGLSPATVKSAYNFPTSSTGGAGKTIAIVDAYDDPTAESDLGVFSSQYG